jgi:hypothetical protein
MIWLATAFFFGTAITMLVCLWKLQNVLLALQELLQAITEEQSDAIVFRSESAPPSGTEGDEIGLEYQTGEPATYDQGCAK